MIFKLFRFSAQNILYILEKDIFLQITESEAKLFDDKKYLNKHTDEFADFLAKYSIEDTLPQVLQYQYTEDELAYLCTNKVRNIVFSLGEECNFRCEYCVYHDKYDKSYKPRSLTKSMIIQAIDWFLSSSSDSLELIVGFYGGESLLHFELIKTCIEYLNSKALYKKIIYLVSTNGLLLQNNDILQYLISNNCEIAVSLDGPSFVHDRYRKDISGDKTYNKIIRILQHINTTYPEYFREKVTLLGVQTPPYDDYILADFFNNTPCKFNLSRVSIYNYFQTVLYNKNIDRSLTKSLKHLYKYIDKNNINIASALSRYAKFHERKFQYSSTDCRTFLSGVCTPVFTRVYVKSEGSLYICEKVNEDNDLYKIGDIKNGIMLSRINNLIKKFSEFVQSKCSKCWATKLCTVCFKDLDNIENMDDICFSAKYRLTGDIEEYFNNIINDEDYCKLLDEFIYD